MLKILLCSLLSSGTVFSANILYLSTIPSPSHFIWNRALAFGLSNKGHNVTMIAFDENKAAPANFTYIHITGMYDEVHDAVDINGLASLTPIQMINEFVNFCLITCRGTIKSDGFQTLLNYPRDFKFDVIVIDVTLGSCMYPFIRKFNYPPTVGVTPFLLPPYLAFNFGNHLYPAYVPWYGLPYTADMTFMERVWNFIYMYAESVRKAKQHKEEYELVKEAYGGDIPSMEELERHISLLLTNTDPVLDRPQPLSPNLIPVGGLHTGKSKKIPKELMNILDKAKNGVILFSLGSNVRSDKLDTKTQRALIDAFRKIPQTVIWKFESDIDDLPPNVIVRKWLPQNDILGHPNVKLFIGHGGALSTQETMFHGVPMICVPFFMDQLINTRSVLDRKLGISLDFRKITTEYVLEKLKEALGNPLYAENMKRLSRTFRDRSETPLERAIFWTEYTLRHGGAQFLSSPARDLPFYVASSLDVLVFFIVIVAVIIVLIYKVLKLIFTVTTTQKKTKVN